MICRVRQPRGMSPNNSARLGAVIIGRHLTSPKITCKHQAIDRLPQAVGLLKLKIDPGIGEEAPEPAPEVLSVPGAIGP